MTPIEAAKLVAQMVASFPNSRFEEKNTVAYERALLVLDAQETQEAIGELIATTKYLPTIAEIRAEITRAKRDRAIKDESARALRRTDGGSLGPYPQGWAVPLGRMLEAASRHDAMARKWYADRGKPYPGDPAERFTEIAKTGARGDTVRVEDILR